jgi:hypothetical protein
MKRLLSLLLFLIFTASFTLILLYIVQIYGGVGLSMPGRLDEVLSIVSEHNEVGGKHKAVDLGLSVKWATCNIGASCPEEIGNYYAWGETQTKNNYEWDNYKWYDGIGITKYPDKYYTGTSLFTMNLEPSDDAAHVIWRGSWRMPTNKECNELKKCRITEAVLNGVKGYKVTASNGKSIFFPQDGYWSSTIHLTDPFLAYGIFSDCSSRYIGRCVRPVCP